MFETTNHLSNLDELENVSYDDILSAEQQAALEREYDSMVIRYNLDKMHKAEMYQRIEQTVISASDKLPPLIPVIRRKGVLICSEGNISAVVGEAKSKKTFLCTALVGSLLDMNKQNRFGIEPLFCKVLWVDTEQSREHIQKVLFRINLLGMIPYDNPNGRLLTQTLREESPAKRLEQLRYGIEYHQPKLVVVDGISDLMSNTNSLEESEALVAELLRLSSVYGCHIMNVLHTNPNSDKARGHLGSTLMRKAETVIFVHRAGEMSIVEPQYCRNMPFDRFAFAVPVYGAISMTGTSGIFGTLYATYPRCSLLWDDVEMLRTCRTPMLFINWPGDPYFAVDATERCASAAMNAGMMLIPDLQHGHLQGADIQEIFLFAGNATAR